tara:strand:+ start:769 stop:1173 length:405 start_codon:yes stop_codon:yes gene_type:complete
MINFFKIMNIILDTVFFLSFLIYVIFFFIKLQIIYLTTYFIIIAILALFVKLIYWLLIKKISKKIDYTNESKIYISRISFCFLFYVTPAYYILHSSNLVVSDFIKLITLIIIFILAILSLAIEKYFLILEFKNE